MALELGRWNIARNCCEWAGKTTFGGTRWNRLQVPAALTVTRQLFYEEGGEEEGGEESGEEDIQC